jgi:aspartyl-tRNA(Asn)/glutamyl-tRNA(Gln) amidotransferase subunit B
MEEGNFRCDANISIRKIGDVELGVKAEIKNINSFKFVKKAIDYEILRQTKLLTNGENVVQETRLYNSSSNKTFSMRSKEDAHDYRYFPDPDLKPLILTQERIDALKSSSLESYNEKMNIYINQYKLSKDDSEVLLSNKSLAKFFDKTLDFIKDPMITSKWIITEIIKYIGLDTFNLKEENFAKFLQAVKEGKINNNSGKELLENLVVSNEDVDVLIDSLDLKQESSEDLLNEVIDKVLENNPDEKKRLLDGELKLLSFFMGQVMRETKGKGNPTVVGDIIRKRFNLS